MSARFPDEAPVFEVKASVFNSMPRGCVVECGGEAFPPARGVLRFRNPEDLDPDWWLSFDPHEVEPLTPAARDILAIVKGA